jgi:type II secretory pathway component GspD/PulD (secretin)
MRLFSVLLLLLWIQAPERAWAEEIPFTFENAEIQTIIKKAGELTGLAFLYDPEQVKGKITLHSPERVAPQEALELLESALALHGYALLRKGNTVWIVPTERAPAGRPAHIEVVPLDYAEAGEVAYTLASLGPEGVRIVPYYPTNSLILYGDPQAVKALIWVIKGKGEAGQ